MESVADGLTKSNPHRLSAATLLLSMPGVKEQLKPVPPAYYFGDHIKCVCGEAHQLGELGELNRYPCGRWLIRARNSVLCFREPEEEGAA